MSDLTFTRRVQPGRVEVTCEVSLQGVLTLMDSHHPGIGSLDRDRVFRDALQGAQLRVMDKLKELKGLWGVEDGEHGQHGWVSWTCPAQHIQSSYETIRDYYARYLLEEVTRVPDGPAGWVLHSSGLEEPTMGGSNFTITKRDAHDHST